MNEELYITFENYLNKEMSQEEQLEFENQLQNDADIRQKFEIYKETNAFLETKFSSETFDFKNNWKILFLKNILLKRKRKNPKSFSSNHGNMQLQLQLQLLFGTWFMMQGNSEYGEFYQHETANLVERR